MVAEILIYVPSIANFRLNWLNDRLAAAHTAALVLDAAPSGMVPESLAKQILKSIGARAVAMKMGDAAPPAGGLRRAVRRSSRTSTCATCRGGAPSIDAFEMLLFCQPDDVIRVVGPAPMGGRSFLEIILDEAPLRKAMLTFSVNILLLSLVISGITAMLVFFALHYLLVRPMRRITANMIAFRADPENPARIIAESGRSDEIGTAEVELAAMQRELASMLHQKNRLAALGLAVSKINHDLRNLLASAQLFSDQLSTLARSKGAALRAQADARARARDRVLPVDAVLRRRAGAAARAQDHRSRAADRGGARGARPRPRRADPLDRRGGARAHRGRRSRSVVPRAGQRGAQRRAGAGGARRARSGARPDPHHRPARGQRGGDRGVRYRPGRSREGARPYVSGVSGLDARRRHRARAWPSPPNWCAPMAAKSGWCREPSARRSASPFPTAPSISTPGAASAQAPKPEGTGRRIAVFV